MDLEPDAQVFDAQDVGCRVRGGDQLNRRLLNRSTEAPAIAPANRRTKRPTRPKPLFLNDFSQQSRCALRIMLYSDALFKSRAAMA